VRLFYVLAVCALLALTGCGYDRKAEIYSATATTTPHFSSIRANILPKCLPCHSTGESSFTAYSGVLKRVSPGSPRASKFYTELESGDMPVDQPMLSDDDLLAVDQWIQNGAAND